ncbi:MAG: adenylate kinase [Spirochaetaceae bacterium]|nr:MAG: adenylate kinase [Spirochaetaceae bacterium]
MQLIFLGPPGAGKGTMATRVAEDHDIPHISTGDIFRYNINNHTELGLQVKSILDSGELVPDDLTIDLVRDRLSQDDCANGFILDGFPRTIAQAEALQSFSNILCVLNFSIPDEIIVERLSGRRVHKTSGRTYHVLHNPPKIAGKDDVTGEELIVRSDDQVESIRKRLAVYYEQTAPLKAYYRDKGMLHEIDATPSPEEVYESMKTILKDA